MNRNQFNLVSDDLLPLAVSARKYFGLRGYRVSVEKSELGYPFTPCLKCVRQQTTLVVDLQSQVQHERLDKWVAYCKSRTRDTRVAVVVPRTLNIRTEQESELRDKGIGCFFADERNLTRKITPRDLTISFELPKLADLPSRLRRLLGHSYERFEESEAIDGFLDACTVLENECKVYLRKGIKSGRIKFISAKGPKTYSTKQINSATMGYLMVMFDQIRSKNNTDNGLYQALENINPDRIKAAHKRSTARRLSQNATHHMWVIVQALKPIS